MGFDPFKGEITFEMKGMIIIAQMSCERGAAAKRCHPYDGIDARACRDIGGGFVFECRVDSLQSDFINEVHRAF